MKIAVVGGTGPQGKGLAYRFARAGHSVVLGSRAAERAAEAAEEIRARVDADAAGAANADAVAGAEVVLLAVPYDGHADLVSGLDLADKVVISCINPLGFDKRGAYGVTVPDGSAAEEAQRLAPQARVVGAFHHLSAVNLWGSDDVLDHDDVLVCGDSRDAKAVAVELSRAVTGRDGIDCGPLRLARQLEPLTAVLIGINRKHKVRAGIRITGL